MKRLEPLRFFAAVAPPPAPLRAVLAILAVGACVLEGVAAGSSDWVLASILLVQTFACSSGFTRHASRGYYDPVLLGAGSRRRIAVAHFAVAAAPGLSAWLVSGFAGAIAAGSLSTPAFRPPGLSALFLVSAVPWAANLRLAPFAVGSLWLLVTGSLLLSGGLFRALARVHADPGWVASQPFTAIALALGFPAVLPSLPLPVSVVGALGCFSLAALGAGVATIERGSFPLSEEGS